MVLCLIVQATEDFLDDTVANLTSTPAGGAKTLARGGERLSLTVRRVLRVKNFLRPKG